ncbi:trypsin-like peptidase domain-containing protein [Pollutibacter soli]|uniref:trypsin-like peptidase domain-containing protein n=1 Tax=Pollutibacter soli TaxID=3034157 RepID=UPI00301368E6
MKFKQVLSVMLISAATTLTVLFAYNKFNNKPIALQESNSKIPANYAGLFDSSFNLPGQPVDFQQAANASTPSVVHITTVIGKNRTASNNLPKRKNPFADIFGDDFYDFFDNPQRSIPSRASGSGVIISEDGYIVTNNHVIDEADEIKVTLSNKKSYVAKMIGTDPSSDLALLKVEAKGLPFLLYGNSDQVKIGQWVLAVGYPLNLETTVTAGIVSAKARSLGLNARKSQTPIESFIQTDAAVNQGNSGGALINTNGELVGIVSAIASPTGAYAGYSYAIPVNIVKKIINDLLQFGTVQRAYLGITYLPENAPDTEKEKLSFKEGQGVLVREVAKDGAMASSGIQAGDYITKINGVRITSGSEMVEQIAGYKPGDKISVTYLRGTKESTTDITLKNKTGNYEVVKASSLDLFGAEFTQLDPKKAKEYGVKGGVIVKKINAGPIEEQTRMKDGFIINKVNGQDITTIEELNSAMAKNPKRVLLEGFYPGFEGAYQYPIEFGE